MQRPLRNRHHIRAVDDPPDPRVRREALQAGVHQPERVGYPTTIHLLWLDGDRMSEPIGGMIVLVIFMALIAWRAWTDD